MKLFTLILIFFLNVISLLAQDYQINFAGTGADTIVETVKVENLTQGKSIEINGSDTLHLLGSITGINTVPDIEKNLRIYPNPMYGNSKIDFVAASPGITTIEICDISGKKITTTQNRLSVGNHSYQIYGLRNGIYIIRIYSQSYSYTGKLVSNGSSGPDVKISYIGNNLFPFKAKSLKSAKAEKTMQYTTGDRLKFTGISGNYSTVVTDIPTQNKTLTFNFVAFVDADGNNYSVVQIGTQIWMAENLKTTKYRNGDSIKTTTPALLDISGEDTPKYQWAFDGDESIVATYGRLYTWYTVTDSRKICPTGWHVPSSEEWKTLAKNFDGGRPYAGGHLKETNFTHWLSPNTGATNSSGFTALPGGGRSSGGTFGSIGNGGYWWTSSGGTTDDAISYFMLYNRRSLTQYFGSKKHGWAVRCLQDENAKNISVSTTAASSITTKSAISGGSNILSLGDAEVIARGVCWNTTGNPTIADYKTTDGSGTESFTSSITNLTANTTYFVRAYATNSVGTGYGETISFKTYTDTVTDIEGNVYYTATIGTQVWIAENLKTTKYNDGTNIPNVTDNTVWANLTTPGYCLYNNDITNQNTYGALYNWYAVNTGKLCPKGWHVPDYAEWTTLVNYLGGENVAGKKLKEPGTIHWQTGSGATNESSFTALPGGRRVSDGTFWGFGAYGSWWCSGENNVGYVSVKSLSYGNNRVGGGFDKKESGFSVRCVKDF